MENYLQRVKKQFEYYKYLGDYTLNLLCYEELIEKSSENQNSIAIIIKHISGNMKSRWTNFLTEDGEKPWRKRDEEFINDLKNKTLILQTWKDGWDSLFQALNSISEKDLKSIVYIRNQGHTVVEAINRQMMHYAYHIGQIVVLGKQAKVDNWVNLSISKGQSDSYNRDKFSKDKGRVHFTEDL